ncbi:MAG: hypothetical protein LUC43_04780 [Burkholderiales bacterium]|nr:hypothetical protein [Burkholderiales bacterium]
MLTEGFLASIIKENDSYLSYIPYSLRTRRLCEIAVENWGGNFIYVPDEHKTMDMFWKAFNDDPRALDFVPSSILSYELCKECILKDGEALEYVPWNFRDEKLCQLAMENGADLKDVPYSYRTAG